MLLRLKGSKRLNRNLVPNTKMSYIRIKDVPRNGKKYTYAYLVKTTWRKRKKPKQTTLKYLGKLYPLPAVKKHHLCINHNLTSQELYKDLLRRELLNHGFEQKNTHLYLKDNCIADLNNLLFYTQEGKEIVLQLHSGFLCHHSAKQLLTYTPTLDKQGQKHYAKILALTGIHLEPEEFVDLYTYHEPL